jgi:hypothetical protein
LTFKTVFFLWLLIFLLPKGMNAPKKVVKLYRYRMQIEEGFRDTKNHQYGLELGKLNRQQPSVITIYY